MNSKINKLLRTVFILSVFNFSTPLLAGESLFEIRADGLACPYCAYGIEKKFMAIKGVKHVDIKLKEGLVKVTGDDKLSFKEQQLKTLFDDAGFTYRTIKKLDSNK
tara:strand:- start:10360 stop:10677 length:318 start_codon:yes stop_codon:yes gene_type:complete